MSSVESLQPEDGFALREYIGVLWARKWSILAITLVGVLAAVLVTQRQTPIYTSKITVIASDPLAQIYARQGGPNMSAEQSLVYSFPVAQCASRILETPELTPLNADLTEVCGGDALTGVVPPQGIKKTLRVAVPPDSTNLEISSSDPNPKVAQAIAQAFALAYEFDRNTQATADLDSRRKPLTDQMAQLNKDLTAANEALSIALTNNDPEGISIAQSDKSRIEQEMADLRLLLYDLSPTKLIPPQIVAPATLPTKPTSPNLVLNVAAGFLVALALGFGLAFLREKLDDRLRGRSDLEDRAGVPVMAVIPQVPRWRKKSEARLITQEQPKSSVSEAYRTLRTSILFASVQRGLKTIMLSSAIPGEGKTTTASNLAVVLADAKKRVILVSADLRKPRLHKFFGLPNDIGLSNVLAGEVQPWEALRDPGVENLRIIASGPVPANPAELLQSERMGELLAELREVADFVILDTPPVLLVADSSALAPLVDGIVLVADAEGTTRGSVAHTRDQLEQVDAPLIGAVLNNFDPSTARSYNYRGYYGYRYRYGGYQYGAGGDGETRRGAAAILTPRRGRDRTV
ncbi:MAG: polysaccharide biosynthesis tyrosine autokinase [Actinobacteria bacterium]|nr:polysaccharide biosynthesis tyrosine autokinase [Actinomycetota bacterium]